jgi:hypothetical protein
VAPIDRARVRLACSNPIQGAAEVADFAYKGAGVDAIFPGSPFERRFHNMHTLSQQIQARGAPFELVGHIVLACHPSQGKCEQGSGRYPEAAPSAASAVRTTQLLSAVHTPCSRWDDRDP